MLLKIMKNRNIKRMVKEADDIVMTPVDVIHFNYGLKRLDD